MVTTPMDIRKRPFSVEFYTNVMLPDGIFDTALKKQWITCFYTNISGAALQEVTVYLEGVGDPGIVPVAHSHFFREIKPGASVRMAWLADFEHGAPGKKLVSFIAQAKGMSLVRTLKNIFVSKTTCDPITGEYSCTVVEGTLKISKLEVIVPKNKWQPCSERYKECRPSKGPWVPTKVSTAFYPNPSYAGIHGDLPFGDPWWKALIFLVLFIIALVKTIKTVADNIGGEAIPEGALQIGFKGKFDETKGIDCCELAGAKPREGGYSEALGAIAGAIGAAAVAAALSDDVDPWWRGQEATPPTKGELTVAEKVDAVFSYPSGAPNAGVSYPVDVKWKYQRITTGNTYTYSVAETQKNTHVNEGVEVEVPPVHNAFAKPLIIKAKFKREKGKLFVGEDLYAFSLLRSPDDMYFLVNLTDDGIEHDEQPNDGTYTGSIFLESAYSTLLKYELKLDGLWRVYVFAQDVNDATPDMLPQIAAKRIGGFLVASGLQITFDPTLPCPLRSQATVTVVS